MVSPVPVPDPGREIEWQRFVRTFARWAVGAALCCALFIVIFDPYDNIPFSPPFARPIMDDNQRYMYPAIARKSRFDSAIFGTSSIRLLNPAHLDREFGGGFAQFGLNDGQAYEQYRIADLFLRHHKAPGTIVWGIDAVWCGTGSTYKKFTGRPFPPWRYDDNAWNDLLYLFNGKTIEIAARVARNLAGGGRLRYGPDGYANFLPPVRDYDLAKVRRKLYGPSGKRPPAAPPEAEATGLSARERKALEFPTHTLLKEILGRLPDRTRKIILFVPYHLASQARAGTRRGDIIAECKARVTRIAAASANMTVIDYMIPSALTRRDENYWDPLHYTLDVAENIVLQMGRVAKSGKEENDLRVLHASPAR